MGFWDKSLRIFNCLCDHGKQSVRRLAQKTGFSKSSVHRLQQAMERRGCHPESWLWETEDGRRWLTRLVVATLYLFGCKRGVGIEGIRLRRDSWVSVMYAEALNSTTSSVTLQSTDRHGILGQKPSHFQVSL